MTCTSPSPHTQGHSHPCTSGLSLLIAQEINNSTSHQLVILSRTHQTSLIASGYNCQTVDYNSPASLQHALMGIDTVISTVTGNPQLRLIEAAVQCRVRRFAPAEFEGQPGLRNQNGLLDRGQDSAIALLKHYTGHIQYTVFVCGILYERFSVNGMMSHRIGVSTGYGNEGDFIANPRQMTSIAPIYDAAQNPSWVCLTSAYDVAQFVVRAISLRNWPTEMNRLWASIDYQTPANLEYRMTMAQLGGDVVGQKRLAPLLATAEGRYDFAVPAYLNSVFPDIHVTRFRDWFLRNWASIP
ncbi:isoflavone reductase family protein [Stemphylium lycopersici]|uniref:NAD(P)-binding protein n=1 Tax=Stemphylium lycopersici TaxID=183478 RepID=A0A364MSH9_STELY|nr:isoflavone reductase family protein [Stemphylium lycopersici]RAR01985.1 NAD(P)-binding protein [Stemphylium lycopersici]